MKTPLLFALAFSVVACGGDIIILADGNAPDVLVTGDSEVATDANGPTDSNAATDSNTPTDADVVGQTYTAVCNFLQRCDPVIYNQLFAAASDCVAYVVSNTGNEFTLPGVSQAELQSIIEWGNSGSCSSNNTFAPTGSLPNAATCSSAIQCQSGNCNVVANGCGTCAGAPAGALCIYDSDCAAPNVCVAGSCAAAQGNGVSCSYGAQCQSGYCALGTTYTPPIYSEICQTPPPLPTEGAGCPGTVCAVGLVCNYYAVCAQPAYVAIGQACNANSVCEGSYCDPNFLVCTPYTAPGGACTSDSQCRSSCVYTDTIGNTRRCDVPAPTACN